METIAGTLIFAIVVLGMLRGISSAMKAESKLKTVGELEMNLAVAVEHVARTGKLAEGCREDDESLVCDIHLQSPPYGEPAKVRFHPTAADGHADGLLHLDYDVWEKYPPPQTPSDPTGSHWATKITYRNIVAFELCTDTRMMMKGDPCRDDNDWTPAKISETNDRFLFLRFPRYRGLRAGRFFRFRIVGAIDKKLLVVQSAFFVRHPTPFAGMAYLPMGEE